MSMFRIARAPFIMMAAIFAGCASSSLEAKNVSGAVSGYAVLSLNANLNEALVYASLAPSGWNAQPWKVRIKRDTGSGAEKNVWTIRVYLDSAKLKKSHDLTGREPLISVGAFLQNLRLALSAKGFVFSLDIEDTIDVTANPLIAVATVTGTNASAGLSTGARDDFCLALMKKRHTEHGRFLDTTVPTEKLRHIETAASGIYAFDKQNRHSAYTALLNASLKATSIFIPKGQLKHAPAFIVVTGGNTPKELVETGMRLEKVWLAATEAGVSIRPWSVALENAAIRKSINVDGITGDEMQMLLLAGMRSEYGGNNGKRMALEKFVSLEK